MVNALLTVLVAAVAYVILAMVGAPVILGVVAALLILIVGLTGSGRRF
jgi:hypothetical protein